MFKLAQKWNYTHIYPGFPDDSVLPKKRAKYKASKSPPQKGNVPMHMPICNKKLFKVPFFVSQDLGEAALDIPKVGAIAAIVDYDLMGTQTPTQLLLSVLQPKRLFVGSPLSPAFSS